MPALLTISYTPNYAGNHRICFRTTEPSYCCYNDDSVSVIGVQKVVIIDLEDFETCLQNLPAEIGCADSTVEGYVQPMCIEQSATLNAVPFIAQYAAESCTAYRIECQESGIAEIRLTDQGLGWLPGEIAIVTITDNSGYGSDATAEAIMACNDANICYVESISIIDIGQFYYFLDQISIDISLPSDPGGTPATAEVTSVDDCGTFTVADCDGTANPAQYQLWGGEAYGINVCSGGAGPDAFKYVVTPNPTNPGSIGPQLLTNGEFDTSVDGWTQDVIPSVEWSSEYGGSASFLVLDTTSSISQDILTEGLTYTVEIQLTVVYDESCDEVQLLTTAFMLYAGTTAYGPYYITGTQVFEIQITCSGNTSFRIEAADPENCTLGMYCSFVGVFQQDPPTPISCCNCVKYDIINLALVDSFDFYYTDCSDQTIKLLTIAGQETLQVCAVESSVWVVDVDNNDNFEYVVSAIQDC